MGVLVGILGLLTWQGGVAEAVAGPLHRALRPVWVGEQSAAVLFSDFFGLLASKRALVLENRTLEARLANVEPLLLERELLREENRMLKNIFGRAGEDEFLLAAILTRPNITLYDTFIVDAGENLGVTEGAVVLTEGESAIGTVSEVYSKTSLIKLFSSPGEKTNVIIGESSTPAVALGRGGGNFEVTLPRGADISVGMLVLLPDLHGRILGVVEEILVNPADPLQTVLFKNPVNMGEARFVEILR